MKTTQTILFATLILAMILPFSGMNYAVAEKQTTDPIRERLLELIQENPTTQSTVKSVPELGLEIYDLQKRLQKSIDNDEDIEKIQKQTDRLEKLTDRLTERYSGGVDMVEFSEGMERPEPTATTQNVLLNKWGTTGFHNICGFQSVQATTAGTVISHLSGIWMDGGVLFPQSLDKGSWPSCNQPSNEYDFTLATEFYYPLSTPNKFCMHPFTDNASTINEYCPNITNGDVVFVIADAVYYKDTNPTKPVRFTDGSVPMIGFMGVSFGGN